MGFDGKYGEVTTELKDIPADEPVFLFRAQDTLAVLALDEYLEELNRNDRPESLCDAVGEAIERFLKWQGANPDRVKQPD